MKNLTIYEKSDLTKFDDQLSFFLQGDNGYYRRNKLDVGSYHPDNNGYLLTITLSIQDASAHELELLKQHVDKHLESSQKDVENYKRQMLEAIQRVHKYEQLKNMVPTYETFRQAFEDISS